MHSPRGLWWRSQERWRLETRTPPPRGQKERRELVFDALAPLLVSLHVVDDAHIDHSSLRFLLAQNLAAQRVEEEEEQKARRQVLLQEFSALLAVPVRSRSLLQVNWLEALAEALDNDSSAASSSQPGRRKKKKRRKRRLPRGVQYDSVGKGAPLALRCSVPFRRRQA